MNLLPARIANRRKGAAVTLALAGAAIVMLLVPAAIVLVPAAAGSDFMQVFKDPQIPLPGAGARQSSLGRQAAVQFISPQKLTIPARRSTLVDFHFHVTAGLHINSHAPHDQALIPTRLAVVEDHGLDVTAVDFPPGSDYAPPFAPRDRLSVYTGDFVLHAHILAQPGKHRLQAALRYQACDANSCLPPHTIPLAIEITAQ